MTGELRERAIRLLARREHTRAELRRKLATGAESADQLEQVLDDLAARQLLSDARYAEQRVTVRGRQLGNARLLQELRRSGVDDALIGSALDAAGNETDRARIVWEKKFGRVASDRNEWAKQARFLQSRGFSADIIHRLLKDPADHDRDE